MDRFQSPAFRSRVEDLMKQSHVPGLAIAIVQNGTVASAGFGLKCVSSGEPVTPDTIFDIASSSKSLTAAAVGLLVTDNDKYHDVQWDTPMSRLLPDDFVLQGEGCTQGVTIDDVLGHITGMPRHDLSSMGVHATKPDTARSVTRNMRNLQPCAPIRSQYMYNNNMYTAATHLVEMKTGMSFSDFLETNFFGPLKMSSTSLMPARAKEKGFSDRLATGHMWDEKEERYREFEALDCPESQGAGSIMTSAADHVKWVTALLSKTGPITPELYGGITRMRSFIRSTTEDLKPNTSPTFYAAGLNVFYYRGHTIIGHNGAVPGFGSRHFFLPELDFGGTIMGNGMEAYVVAQGVAQDLIDHLLQVPQPEILELPATEAPTDANVEIDKKDPAWKELYPKLEALEPQKMPLDVYVGEYWNPGYQGMTVTAHGDQLSIDATDRTFPFRLLFKHVCGQTQFLVSAVLGATMGGMTFNEHMKAEFRFKNDKTVKLGLALEEALEEVSDGYIWFDKVDT